MRYQWIHWAHVQMRRRLRSLARVNIWPLSFFLAQYIDLDKHDMGYQNIRTTLG